MKSRESHEVGTARWTAAARAQETRRVDRLFADPFADALAGEVGWFALEASERMIGGENAYLPIRTRWFDDLVLQQARQGWQVVVLGAGFDTRAMRLVVPPSVRWFELDHEATFARKEPLLLAAGATATCTRTCILADLIGHWSQPLIAAGFELERPTLWLAEGLLGYLEDATVDRLLSEARSLSAPGSLFAADVFSTPIPTRDATSRRFASSDPEGLFARAGWSSTLLVEPWQLAYATARLAAARRAEGAPAVGRAWFVTAGV